MSTSRELVCPTAFETTTLRLAMAAISEASMSWMLPGRNWSSTLPFLPFFGTLVRTRRSLKSTSLNVSTEPCVVEEVPNDFIGTSACLIMCLPTFARGSDTSSDCSSFMMFSQMSAACRLLSTFRRTVPISSTLACSISQSASTWSAFSPSSSSPFLTAFCFILTMLASMSSYLQTRCMGVTSRLLTDLFEVSSRILRNFLKAALLSLFS
mmetsp:Transcript_19493/g.74804  ORF Transcript_19493/g.74804 Transcript_19493/m.74804 type:complete len:210 (-) Transcript_19493:1558-2187(-)